MLEVTLEGDHKQYADFLKRLGYSPVEGPELRGRDLVYRRDGPNGSRLEVAVHNSSGGGLVEFTFDPGYDAFRKLSPKGCLRRLAFEQAMLKGGFTLYETTSGEYGVQKRNGRSMYKLGADDIAEIRRATDYILRSFTGQKSRRSKVIEIDISPGDFEIDPHYSIPHFEVPESAYDSDQVVFENYRSKPTRRPRPKLKLPRHGKIMRSIGREKREKNRHNHQAAIR